jgi:autotransporter-associated beta strand protein
MSVNSSSYVRLLRSGQIGDSSAVEMDEVGWLLLDGHNESIGSLAGEGAVFQSAAQTGLLTVGGNGDSTTFEGVIHGGGGLTKTGAGTFTLTANNLYTGTTTVNGGKLLVLGQQRQSPVSLLTGGCIGGTGRVGNISDLVGNIAPGASPGILVCSNFSTFGVANQLQIEINGATPGSGHDQLQVNGSVLLMGGTVHLSMNFSGAISNRYVMISNDGVDPVTGSFTGLPEGATLTSGAVTFQITYQGGDGNDVVLIQKTLPTGPQIGSIQKLTDGKIQIRASGLSNTTYQVEATASLNPPIFWTGLGPVTADSAGLIQFIDANASSFPMRFYRFALP